MNTPQNPQLHKHSVMLSYSEWKTEVIRLLNTKPHIKVKWKTQAYKICYASGYTPQETVKLAWLQS